MAVLRNVSNDDRALFRTDGASVRKGDHVEIDDEQFAGRAWPKSTWQLVKKPDKARFVDESGDDAYVFTPQPTTPADEADLKEKS